VDDSFAGHLFFRRKANQARLVISGAEFGAQGNITGYNNEDGSREWPLKTD
jgi:hypothetical protein